MECADCGVSLDHFMAGQAEIGRISPPLCFSCYLDSTQTAYDYSNYEPSRRYQEYKREVQTALSKTNKFKVEILLKESENEGLVLFAPAQSDAVSLIDAIINSELGHFISETNIASLSEIYSEGDQKFCWEVANWKYHPYLTHTRSGPSSISIVRDIPCIVDVYRYLGDECEEKLFDELLDRFLEEADIDRLDSLKDTRTAAEAHFPLVSELGLSFSIHVEKYFRRNADLLSTNFKTLSDDGSLNASYESSSREELKNLYETQVEEVTIKEEILELLELAEGASSEDIAKVVDCSVSYARRFKYDHKIDSAIEKEWSQSAQKEKVSPGTRDKIINRDGACLRCGDENDLTVHHIVPISLGGVRRDENLATLCESCHKAAHGGSYYPPTTVYNGHSEFGSWRK